MILFEVNINIDQSLLHKKYSYTVNMETKSDKENARAVAQPYHRGLPSANFTQEADPLSSHLKTIEAQLGLSNMQSSIASSTNNGTGAPDENRQIFMSRSSTAQDNGSNHQNWYPMHAQENISDSINSMPASSEQQVDGNIEMFSPTLSANNKLFTPKNEENLDPQNNWYKHPTQQLEVGQPLGPVEKSRLHNRQVVAREVLPQQNSSSKQQQQHFSQTSKDFKLMPSEAATAIGGKKQPSITSLHGAGGNSVLVHAGQYASQNVTIPVRENSQQLVYTNGEANAKHITHQQQQHQLYQTAKTQMYEKMILQQHISLEQKPPQSTSHFINKIPSGQSNQNFNQSLQQQSNLFPRIGNVRNDTAAMLYKTPTTNQTVGAINNSHYLLQQNQIQQASPFMQQKLNSKNKTVSPRNVAPDHPKMLLMQEKNQLQQANEHYAKSMVDSNQGSSSKQSDKIYRKNGQEPDKFGAHLLMNSDSRTAIAAARLQSAGEESLQNQHQFYVGEMSLSGDYAKRGVGNEMMSSQSGKRQSHHVQMYNQSQQAIIQQQIATDQGHSSLNHNFFSRRTVSNKEAIIGNLKAPHSQPAHHQLQGLNESGQYSQTAYPFSPGSNNYQQSADSRLKFAASVNGNRASHESSPIKGQVYNGILEQQQQLQDGTQLQQEQQQAVKIPVICGFHKRVLLLTSGTVAQGAPGQPIPPPGTQAQQSRESINKKLRNRNPNCNHNNNSVFYAPCYNNVKYDDSYKKKEEVLRKVFFKECAREDEKRNISLHNTAQSQAISQAISQPPSKPTDPFSYLKPIENFLMSTLFVDYDNQQAAKQNPNHVPTRVSHSGSSLFMELGLENAIVAHKAFLLALIQSGKVTNENMLKVLHEFKSSAVDFDHECIYCKYSQYALRESTKVMRNALKAASEQQSIGSELGGDTTPSISMKPIISENGQDNRIEYLIRMFQSQLFKRSFINTSLMIIQRKMNEKLLQKQRLPPGIGQNQINMVDQKQKKPVKNAQTDKKGGQPPMSSLDWIASQMQKLAKNLSNPKDKDKYVELKEKYYREFLVKINLSNNLVIQFPKTTFTPYKYYIGKGNNSILVRNCLKQRFWWSMGDFDDWDDYNFIWTQWKTNKIIAKIKTNSDVQAEQGSKGGSGITKDGPLAITSESMLSTDRDSNSSAETLLTTPTKRKRVATALQNSNNPVQSQKKTISASKTSVLTKAGTAAIGGSVAAVEDSKKETSHSLITYSHMENNFHLSNKKALYYNMKIYYESIGADWFGVLPLTFHVKEGPSDKEFQKFLEVFRDYDSGKASTAFEKLGKQIWIVKPGENTNRGCGIQVCRELSQIKEIVGNTNVNGQKRSYIIQKYIEKPLLYKNRKFDIRCYTLLTTVNGNLQGYWYNEGYLRTSSKDFNLKNVTNRLIHLTNDAVQKKSDDYGKFESGNKLSYPDFQKYLDSIDIKCNFVKEIVPQLKKIAADTIKACSRKVDPHRRHNTFEIFGYDFMIDDDLKPWLIEVNTNPCLELSAPYLSRLIPTMIENAIKIAVDPIFPPPPWPNAKKHMIPECMENNRFELVFNELTDSAELKTLPIDEIAMNGIIEEEEMEDEGSEMDGDEEEIA